jgi:ribosome-associated protein
MLTDSQWDIIQQEIDWQAVTASGPGGQNVNKTATKIQLRWSISQSRAISETLKQQLMAALSARINSQGQVMLDIDDTRSQSQNKHLGLERLQQLLSQALKPKTPRLVTHIPKRAKVQRQNHKRLRSRLKTLRKPVAED